MSNDSPTSLGAMYENNVRRQTLALPSVPGTSIGSAYEAWFEADQEAEWLRNLEARKTRASSDDTQVISQADVAAYRERMDAERADAVSDVSRETAGATATGEIPQTRRSTEAATSSGSPESASGQEADGGTSSILRSSALMASGTLVSRVLGLGRSVLTVAALGSTGAIANTWDVANTLPNIIYLLLAGGVINAVLVPQITRALDHSDGGKAYTDRIVTLTLAILLGVTAAFMLGAPLVYRLFDNNHITSDKLHVAWILSLICLPQIFFYGVYTILGQILNARGRFGAFMWSPALANVVIIIGLIWFMAAYPHGTNVPGYSGWSTTMMLVLALPATIGIAVQAIVLVPVLRKAGYSFTPNFQFRGVGLRSASTMAGWAFAAVIVQQVGLIITSQLLSGQAKGEPGKAAQSQAFLLFTLPHSLVTLSLVTALFTRMSVAANRGETQKVKDDMTTGIRLSGIASVMLTFGCFALVFPLVGAMFGAGESNLWSIGSIAVAMMVGLVPYSLCLVIQRVFYAYNDAKTPFWMQIICTATAIALTVPWFFLRDVHMFGHRGAHWIGIGVGLAQTLSNVVQAAVGFVLIQRKIGHVPMTDTIRTYVRLSIAALAATFIGLLVTWGMHHLVPASRLGSLLDLLVTGSIFLAVYLAAARRLRIREINDLLGPLTRRLGRA